jgi:hypothetical protein
MTTECAVETCHRTAVLGLDRPTADAPAKWAVCRTCWTCLIGVGPYIVQAVWNNRNEIERFVALRPRTDAEDDRGPILGDYV